VSSDCAEFFRKFKAIPQKALAYWRSGPMSSSTLSRAVVFAVRQIGPWLRSGQ